MTDVNYTYLGKHVYHALESAGVAERALAPGVWNPDCILAPDPLCDAKFKLKLKKVGKTTRPFRYDLNQIPYNYTVEVMNRFMGLDLVGRVPDELWTEVPNTV